tara:strand:- start:21137 stop:21598 length:462 start_codon:yes stop_codon:yes gene_type:complete
MQNISNTWKSRYLDLAERISHWSKDPSTKVGCIVIGKDGQVLSQGFNGFPRKFSDDLELYVMRETKYRFIVHAEMNAIYHATLNGISLKNSVFFIHGLHVCHECAKALVQVGAKGVVMRQTKETSTKWAESFHYAQEILTQGGIEYEIFSSES